ncbi:hypothetical protein BC937DRAFT_89319 [Endogone sp. FLAS-F59071]|nr:hypothetical protein BC937DRAFT_89319 [Endogone sp. FLAS-F59071]|eukprot:RUS22412.1 hypothetical protein BC937DRAFT_89319 [Endogone sp. FLAS-F59071]
MPPQGDLDALTPQLQKASAISPKLVVNQTESKSAASPEPVAKPSGFKFTPLSFDKLAASPTGDGAVFVPRTTAATSPQASTSSSSADAANIGNLPDEEQRKLDRAKRFGIPLSEETKKTVRAAKFGVLEEKQTVGNGHNGISYAIYAIYHPATASGSTSPTRNGSATSVRESKSVIDPEVLKRRQERFGMISGNNNRSNKAPTAATKVLDPVEEEKKRKRLERFGSATSDTSQKGDDGGLAKKSKS